MGRRGRLCCLALCLCCKFKDKPKPENQVAPNQSTLTHMDNSVSFEKGDRPTGKVKKSTVLPLTATGKTTIVTGNSVMKQYIATSPVNPTKLAVEPAEEPSLSSIGHYVPVSFSESSQSGRDLPSQGEEKVDFCDKNSDLASVQDLAVAGRNLQIAEKEIAVEREFEDQVEDFNAVVQGVNFRQLLQDSQESV